MARYGQAFKERAVARLLPPESSSVETVSREIGVGVATLERWRSEALAQPARAQTWTAAARLEAVIATVTLDAEKGEQRRRYYRELFRYGLTDADIHDIRRRLSANQLLGDGRFKDQSEAALGRKVGKVQRGRSR